MTPLVVFRFFSKLGIVSIAIFSPVSTLADTLAIYFPPALESTVGITSSTGQPLNGNLVRAGIFTVTPSQLLSNLGTKTSASDIRTTIHASFVEYTSFSMADAYLNNADQAVVMFTGEIFSCTAVDALGARTGNYAVTQIDDDGNPTGTGGEISLIDGAIVGVTKAGSGYVSGIATIDGRQITIVLKSMNKTDFLGKDSYLLFYNNATEGAATEMGIFRMAIREDNPDGATGIFPTGNNAAGGRDSSFYFADANGILGPESFLNLLVGQYNATTDSYTLGALEGGIGQITSPLTETNASGAVSTYQIVANNGADRFFATTNTANADLTLTNLPTGFSIATNTGVITAATNALPSTNTIRLVASNSLTASVATNTLTWVLKNPTLSFTNGTNSITATLGKGMTSNFTSTGTDPTYTVASGKLFGLTLSNLSGVGVLSGTPTSVGSNSVWIQATAGTNIGATNFTLVVNPFSLGIAGLTGVLTCTSGVAQTFTVTNSEGYTDLRGELYSVSDISALSFNGSSLVISKDTVPQLKGADNVSLTLTAFRAADDGSRVSSSTTVPLRIVAPTPTALVGPTEFEVDVGQAFSTTILSDAGAYGRMSFSNLPSGLVGNQNGVVAGTNTSTNLPYEFPVKVVADSTRIYEGGGTYTNTNVIFRLRNTSPPYFVGTNRYLLAVGRAASGITLQASNFPFKYTASNLPAGLQLNGDIISGVPTVAANSQVQITAYNSYRPGSTNPDLEQPGYGTLILNVAGARPTAATALSGSSDLRVGTPASFSMLAAEQLGLRIAGYGFPPGLSINPSTGLVTGTPTATGTYAVTVFIQNGKGWIKKTVSLTVR
jgi:hypothetical protein